MGAAVRRAGTDHSDMKRWRAQRLAFCIRPPFFIFIFIFIEVSKSPNPTKEAGGRGGES